MNEPLPPGKIMTTWARFPRILLLTSGLTLLTAACATETGSDALSADTATASVTDSQEEMVCQSVKVTGSNFAKKVCRSKRVWAAIEGNERRIADEYGRQTRENSTILEEGSSRGMPQ